MGQPRQTQLCAWTSPTQSVEASTIIWGIKFGLQVHLDLPALYLILTDMFSFSLQGYQNNLYKIAKLIHFLSQCIKWTSLRLSNRPNRKQVSLMAIQLSPPWWHLPSVWQVTSWGQWPLDQTEPILLCGAQSRGLHLWFRSLNIHAHKRPNL